MLKPSLMDSKKGRCDTCKKFVYLSDLKESYQEGQRKQICKSCFAKIENAKITQRTPAVDPSKMPYYCARCKYKFRVNIQKGADIRCPYCGKTDKVSEMKEISSESLLREVS